ncbi:MAG: YraN family protein [Alphaproteobacteria bacterium]|nr:YraN family protein [Alphaproteobacteria bacterium]
MAAGPRSQTDIRQHAERRGRRAETLASLWLRLRGYRILARRHRGPMGEIDLIARHGGLLVAVEVKARANLEAGLASVSPRQRQRIARTLRHFQAQRPALGTLDLRVDLVIMRPWRVPVVIADVWHPDG